ncbi:TlpA family protein disulfide reductase [Vibrio mediterranei]|uniref:TlpA family protein disulfide reductase n=1 Tax=Vibrio mediterranei TaxID=689 RepID=UPI0017A6946C|nr:TlpA disulfide reductase family protein [Vibrio mediterranei]NUW75834.1 TlpA family protein disulfide reductase [Vibrio mediterranei]
MWRNYLLIPLLSTVVIVTGCKEQVAKIGAESPDIVALDSRDTELSIHDYKGKKVVLEFWSSTCGACIAMMKKWQDIYQRRSDEVAIIAINIDQYDVDLDAFRHKYQFTFPIGKDQLGISKERFSIGVTPTTYLINQKGTLVDMHIGYSAKLDLDKVINIL